MDSVESVLNAQDIDILRNMVCGILIEDRLISFITKIVTQTRNHKSIYLGASPRASLGIMNASKAIAAMSGRDFVTPEDILRVIPSVLRHRIVLTPEKEMEGLSTDDVVQQIVQSNDIPR